MQWILTGAEEHWKDYKALGREAGVQKQDEAAKRRNKKALLKHRPDKTKTEKRKALSNTKTE